MIRATDKCSVLAGTPLTTHLMAHCVIFPVSCTFMSWWCAAEWGAPESGVSRWPWWRSLRSSVGPQLRSWDRWLMPWTLRCTRVLLLKVAASSRCWLPSSIISLLGLFSSIPQPLFSGFDFFCFDYTLFSWLFFCCCCSWWWWLSVFLFGFSYCLDKLLLI